MISTSNLSSDNLAIELRRVRLERLLQAAAHDFDLRFEFGIRNVIGKSHIIMKAGVEEIASVSYALLKGRALNLLGHRLCESQTWAEAARREEEIDKPLFSQLWHALEDARIENWMIARWPGTHKTFEAYLLPDLIRLMPPHDQLELGLYLVGRGNQGARFSPIVRATLDGISPELTRAAHSNSGQDTFNTLSAIYESLAHLIPRDRQRKPKRSAQAAAEDLLPDEGKTIQSKEFTPEKHFPNGVPDFVESEELFSMGLSGRRQEFPEWFRPGSAPWFERGIGEKKVHPTAIQSNRQTIIPPPSGDNETYRVVRTEIQRDVSYLTKRMLNRLREDSYLRFGGQYRSGKLYMAKLWKQRTGSYRLFQRQVAGGSKAVAFTLLVDESASMKGQDKYKTAIKAAVLLGETLDTLDAPLEIIGFTTTEYEARAAMKLGLTPAYKFRTTRCSPLEHRIYKRFDEPYRFTRTRLTGIQPRKNNWDEEHLQFAFQRIQERPESRRVIIVISDGQPNGNADHLIKTIQRIESLGVEVIGIGIGAEFVKQIYTRAIVVSDFKQMADELLRILAREFQNVTSTSRPPELERLADFNPI